jgi:hypothetical protein
LSDSPYPFIPRWLKIAAMLVFVAAFLVGYALLSVVVVPPVTRATEEFWVRLFGYTGNMAYAPAGRSWLDQVVGLAALLIVWWLFWWIARREWLDRQFKRLDDFFYKRAFGGQ